MSALAKSAARRYPRKDRFARHFAAGKLRADPVFAHLLRAGLIPDGARLLDLGCGQGLLAALLHAAGASGAWPDGWASAPRHVHFRGIERSARDAQRARHAAGANGEVLCADIRDAALGKANLVVLLDVLHYIDRAAQADVLARVRQAVAEGGTVLMRVADADGSWRFRVTEWADNLAVIIRGGRAGKLHSRPATEWIALLESLGFTVRREPMSDGTPFRNVLLVARYDPARN